MLGVIANANAGKSTAINCVLGQRILPTKYKCCTSVITNVSLVDLDKPLMMHECEEVRDRREIKRVLAKMNEAVREDDKAKVVDISLYVRPEPKKIDPVYLANLKCDGLLKLVDMPGFDEKDNSVVKACLKMLVQMCHGLWILCKYDAIKSDGFAELIRRTFDEAPHLLRMEGAMTFVITQVDLVLGVDADSDSDSGDEDREEAKMKVALDDLESELRQFLLKRLPEHSDLLSKVKILKISVNKENEGCNDFKELIGVLGGFHQIRAKLRNERKLHFCTDIAHRFEASLNQLRSDYPVSAKAAIDDYHQKRGVCLFVAVVGTLVTLPFGAAAITVGCVVRGAIAVGGAVMMAGGIIIGNNQDGPGARLGGERLIMSARAQGVTAALDKLKDMPIDASKILDNKTYKDYLMSEGKVLYVGELVGKLPHGEGRLFWKDSQYESFMGTFVDGRLQKGDFLIDQGTFLGSMERSGGEWKLSARQLDDPEGLGICAMCMEQPSLSVTGQALKPCGHSDICADCSTKVTRCPTCRRVMEGTIAF